MRHVHRPDIENEGEEKRRKTPEERAITPARCRHRIVAATRQAGQILACNQAGIAIQSFPETGLMHANNFVFGFCVIPERIGLRM